MHRAHALRWALTALIGVGTARSFSESGDGQDGGVQEGYIVYYLQK